MDLGRYINQLLKHRNEVYVKGLGTFKRMHTSSVFDEKKAVYLPPVTYLEFDAKSIDGIDFVDYFQQGNQLSRGEAEQKVEEEVIKLLQDIKDKGTGSLNHLGQFIKHGNSLVFKAEDLANFSLKPVEGNMVEPANFQSTLEDKQISGKSPAENELVNEIQDVAIQDEKEQPQDELSNAETLEEISENEDRTNSNKAVWYITAAVIALGVIGSLFYLNRETVDQANKSIGDSTTLLVSNTKDSLGTAKIGADSVTSNSADSDSMSTLNVKDSVESKLLIPKNHHYQIVIGSHATLAKAYEQAESFNKAGITSVRVVPSKLARNLKKVIWDSYETKKQADSALRYVRRHYVSDAWSGPVNK